MDPVYVFNIGKAAVGAVQHFAVASKTSLAVDDGLSKSFGSVEFYPNPASKVLNLKVDNNIRDFKVEITDMSGKQILTTENQTQIDITHLKPGIYLGKVISNGRQLTKKIIVQ
jgi:aminopeptidase YwaD